MADTSAWLAYFGRAMAASTATNSWPSCGTSPEGWSTTGPLPHASAGPRARGVPQLVRPGREACSRRPTAGSTRPWPAGRPRRRRAATGRFQAEELGLDEEPACSTRPTPGAGTPSGRRTAPGAGSLRAWPTWRGGRCSCGRPLAAWYGSPSRRGGEHRRPRPAPREPGVGGTWAMVGPLCLRPTGALLATKRLRGAPGLPGGTGQGGSPRCGERRPRFAVCAR